MILIHRPATDSRLSGESLDRHVWRQGEPIPDDALWIDMIEPSREDGGRTNVRSTMLGTPPAPSVETRASPTPSCVMASLVSKSGLGRNVSAAVATAFCSRGV